MNNSKILVRANAVGLILVYAVLGLLLYQQVGVRGQSDLVVLGLTLLQLVLTVALLLWLAVALKQRQAALEQAQHDLRIAEQHLATAHDCAEQAARMKSDFLANMSHEIRTPMNAVLGMSHLALGTNLTAKQRDYVRKIQLSGRHLLGLINDILDFTKLEAGDLRIENIEFDLNGVLENVANLVGDKCADKGLELIFDVDPALPNRLIGDPLRLGQILINYANNAVKFTEAGEVMIAIQQVHQDATHVVLQLEVRDTGIGMTPEQQAKVFDFFSQPATLTKVDGAGLGLSITKKLAALMGGEAGVSSRAGGGSRFWVTVKLGIGVEDFPRNRPTPDMRGRRVLVVDDNDTARQITAQMLREMTFEVSEASSGAQGLERVAEQQQKGEPIEIAFLDWQMPEMDGVEVARRMAKLPRPPSAVLITSFGREEFFKEAERAGIRHALVKPVNASVLFDTAIRALGSEPPTPFRLVADQTHAVPNLSAIKGARILLVDDNEMNQQLGLELLSAAGLVVDLADNGQMGLDMLHERDYDLVLMDMQMPILDGVAATKTIRQDRRWNALPILAMTANALESDRERCLSAGMNAHLTKPIDPQLLYDAMLQWIPPKAAAPLPKASAQRNGPHRASVLENALRTVPGLNVSVGLKRVLNQLPTYQDLLRRFLAGSASAAQQARDHLHKGSLSEAERCMHTLCGTAGTIGAADIAQLASDVEKLLRQGLGSAAIQAPLQLLEEQLGAFVAALKLALDSALSDEDTATPPSTADSQEVLQRLAQYLVDNDAQALSWFHTHSAALEPLFGPDAQTIRRALEELRLDDALLAILASANTGELLVTSR